MKHKVPATPNFDEVKITSVRPLTDTEAQITYLVFSFPFREIHCEMFTNHVRNEDPFRVMDSGLHYQISPQVHHLPEFVTWIANSYQNEKNTFFATSWMVILKITPLLI